MNKIPKSFMLYGIKWNVILDKNLMYHKSAKGVCSARTNTITLNPPTDLMCFNVVLSTFWHEALHAIRDYSKLDEGITTDEELIVDLEANGIMQILTSMEF